jgi:ABC-type multidrug transport system ATPase subunit
MRTQPARSAQSSSASGVVAILRPRLEAWRGVAFRATAGDGTGLVGANGAGKTTLLLIVSTLISADRGRMPIGGRNPPPDTAPVGRLLGRVLPPSCRPHGRQRSSATTIS